MNYNLISGIRERDSSRVGWPISGVSSSPMPLTFETRLVGNVAVVTCRGPLVFGEQATELHIAAKQHLADRRPVLLDLTQVPSMDSAGVGALFAIYTSSLSGPAKVALCGLTPLVQNVLQTCMLLPLVKTYPDAEKALAGMS